PRLRASLTPTTPGSSRPRRPRVPSNTAVAMARIRPVTAIGKRTVATSTSDTDRHVDRAAFRAPPHRTSRTMATRERVQERPLSPHLQVYRWQITMVMSILHRATGVALTIGTLGLAWWLLALAAGGERYAQASAL